MINDARGIFNRLLPDVHIFTDHKAGAQARNSPGYGISLVAETTSGCFLSVDTTISYARGDDEMDVDEKKELMPPEDDDSTHQNQIGEGKPELIFKNIRCALWKVRLIGKNCKRQKYKTMKVCSRKDNNLGMEDREVQGHNQVRKCS
ncbi:hypothetical protein L6452_21859 [Arctium lappa]|uniref:Uncharacterized protein n=1 Tax=Arctium lappa TaxID=4217 RepID=A0ACB9AYJ9_ARCLA|nr:hypothetical protein L6452_21859 [Arctium lappa]